MKMAVPEGMLIFDDVLTHSQHHVLYNMACNSFFKAVGWRDTVEIEHINHPCIHSEWSPDDLTNSNFLNYLTNNDQMSNWLSDKVPCNCIVNLSHPGDVYYHHTHRDEFVALYYLNKQWQREWGGETLFYDPTATDLIYACEIKPQRVVCFDGNIPHTIRPASYAAPKYRLTMTVVFKKKEEQDNGSTSNTSGV